MSDAPAPAGAVRALLDGKPASTMSVDDRGLRYGDGLFETVRVFAGQPLWWDLHMARLVRGSEVLGLQAPPTAVLAGEAAQLCAGVDDAVLRVLLTRAGASRGYAPNGSEAHRLLLLGAAPPPTPGPLRVGWADLALAIQPRLAGIKHLNRLEQVLAAGECAAGGHDELLLCDSDGAVVSAIAGNLFVVRAGAVHTPLVDRCGVAGTCRAWLLARHPEVRVARLSRADVEDADELFLCNSVRGILPVARLGGRALPLGPVTRAWMAQLAGEVPALRHPLLEHDLLDQELRIDG